MAAISYSVGNFSPLPLLCDDELSKNFERLSDKHAVFSVQLDNNDMISLSCMTDHHAYVNEVLYVCIATCIGTDYFHRHFTKGGSDEHSCTTEPYQPQHPDTTTGNWCWTPAISADILDANKVETTASVGGYLTTATTTKTTTKLAPVLLTPAREFKPISNHWGGG
jgi:hypothetical protein